MFRQFILRGGAMMLPLVACSILLFAVIFERAWLIFLVRMTGRKISDQERTAHRAWFSFLMDVAVTLGLFGTVVGMGRAFGLLEGTLRTEAAGPALATAVLTTQYGIALYLIGALAGFATDRLLCQAPRVRVRASRTGSK